MSELNRIKSEEYQLKSSVEAKTVTIQVMEKEMAKMRDDLNRDRETSQREVGAYR